jgi:hypothetical protein
LLCNFSWDFYFFFDRQLAISRFLYVIERDNLNRAKQFSTTASNNTPAAQRTITTASGRTSTFLGAKPPTASPQPTGSLTATAQPASQPASDSPAAVIAALSARYNEFRALSGTRALTAQETEIAKSIRAEIEKLTAAITSAAASGAAPARA